MKFGKVFAADCSGGLLAHSLRAGGGKWKKGRALSDADAQALAQDGVREVVVARPEPGDIGEDPAAARIASPLAGENIRAAKPLAGRVNFFAERSGLLRFDPAGVVALNRASPEVALAVLAPDARARRDALVATLKIIPFAVNEKTVAQCESAIRGNNNGNNNGECKLSVAPFVPRRAALIQTVLPGLSENILRKTRRVTESRLAELQCELAAEKHCAHDAHAVADAMRACESECENNGGESPRLYLVAGASAVCDSRDEIPEAMRLFGGEDVRVGMPADPGNLLALSRAGNADLVGLPGCARSPKFNGLDLILARLCADLPPDDDDIAAMGVGGLFCESPERPVPRAPRVSPPKVCAILLAAGAARRMGGENKLLAQWRGRPLVAGAATTLADARTRGLVHDIVVVVGREMEKTKAALAEFNFRFAENPDYADGMSTSLRAGIRCVPKDADAALVVLGDMPAVSADDIASVVAAFSPDGGDIAVPTCDGKRGNPVLLGRAHFAALLNIGGDSGARMLFSENAHRIREAAAGPGVLLDIDTPEALATLSERDGSDSRPDSHPDSRSGSQNNSQNTSAR